MRYDDDDDDDDDEDEDDDDDAPHAGPPAPGQPAEHASIWHYSLKSIF